MGETVDTTLSEQEYAVLLKILRKQNLKETEEVLRREAGISLASNDGLGANDKSNPTFYQRGYESFLTFVEKSLDLYRSELAQLLYPIFVHLYLNLVARGYPDIARQFFASHHGKQESFYDHDLVRLQAVTQPEHMQGCELVENLRRNKHLVHLCTESYQTLTNYLQSHQLTMILNVIEERMTIEVVDGAPRNRLDLLNKAGATGGEASHTANKSKVLYGVPRDPIMATAIAQLEEEELESIPDDERPKKKKPKKDPSLQSGKRGKSVAVPHAPQLSRLPLPKPREDEVQAKVKAFKEAARCTSLSPSNLPSICFYSILNSKNSLCAVSLSDDATLLAGCFDDSLIRIWTLTPKKLLSMKPPSQLATIPLSAEDIMDRILDTSSNNDVITLTGHSGPVYSTSFSPDKSLLLSASEDGTVRLWSLLTHGSLLCFRGHNYPIWCVEFSPLGFYFATSSYDRTTRLWSTDHIQPLKILAGHYSDVECLKFHPNGNYIATGSCDLSVRLWDILNGQCVRIFTGHKASILVLAFSPDGRYLASSGADCTIRVWDLSLAVLVCEFKRHQDTVHSLVFSRDGTLLASGGMDQCVILWDTSVFEEEQRRKNASTEGLLSRFPTKSTPIHKLHFTRKNLLLAVGPYTS
ncbi:transcription initiation factor TFIID subunit 5-like [Dysidea avara]|uniref:transcription initiation factor TFIID subunit 5-like n=1 Tax=Dysidea avara TaxID=196820 RepID=UPI0033207D43